MRRILAVDDDKDILFVLQFILEDSGYTVETLADGQKLFETINSFKPDLILLDVMLGNADGRLLCSDVKTNAATHDIRVILISASHVMADVQPDLNRPDDFVAKPFDISELLNRIEKQLVA